jgi:hypothetical protein
MITGAIVLSYVPLLILTTVANRVYMPSSWTWVWLMKLYIFTWYVGIQFRSSSQPIVISRVCLPTYAHLLAHEFVVSRLAVDGLDVCEGRKIMDCGSKIGGHSRRAKRRGIQYS